MLIIDEVGSLTQYVDQEDETAVNVARMIQKIAAICGNKARGFNMRGIFISQRAAGLSWLRNAALMVIAHQTLMMNERLLVCKNNRAIADDMSTWPQGWKICSRIRSHVIAIRETARKQWKQRCRLMET